MPWTGPLFDGHACSLGYEVLDWIEAFCCHGPGDVQGESLDFDDEIRDFVVECYRLSPETGRRLRREVVLSRPKGRAKSEVAGLIAVAEALGPVRFDGWDADGQPVGKPIRSPLIKCLATEEGQAGNTFENAAFVLGQWGPDAHPEVFGGIGGVRRYQSASAVYLPDGGELRACTAGAASKDGGKETFAVIDETHLYVLNELRSMYATVSRNLPKRRLAEPWALQTTTAYRPGENSIAEATLTAWRKGQLPAGVHVDHREAKGRIDIEDRERTIKQLTELYGSAMHPETGWMDPVNVYETMIDPTKCPDHETAARYYLNRPMSSRDAWIPDAIIERQARPGDVIADGDAVTLGFDGSLNDDSTVLIACRMTDGLIAPIGVWEKPAGHAGLWWEVPRPDVLETIRAAMTRFDVVRMYADPHEWRSDIDSLQQEFGKTIVPWPTSSHKAMSAALNRWHTDLTTGTAWHNGDLVLMEHLRNTYVQRRGSWRLVRKEHPQSDRKIDGTVGATLAYEARADAITAGWTAEPNDSRFFFF